MLHCCFWEADITYDFHKYPTSFSTPILQTLNSDRSSWFKRHWLTTEIINTIVPSSLSSVWAIKITKATVVKNIQTRVFPQGQIYLTLPISAYSNKICNVTVSSMSSKKSKREQNMPSKAKLIPSSVQKIPSSEDFNKKTESGFWCGYRMKFLNFGLGKLLINVNVCHSYQGLLCKEHLLSS